MKETNIDFMYETQDSDKSEPYKFADIDLDVSDERCAKINYKATAVVFPIEQTGPEYSKIPLDEDFRL